MNKEEKQPAYGCRYIGLGENCHLHSGLTEHGHTQMACVGKCKDYRKNRNYEQDKEAPSDGRKKS